MISIHLYYLSTYQIEMQSLVMFESSIDSVDNEIRLILTNTYGSIKVSSRGIFIWTANKH